MAASIKMSLGMELGLGPGDFVLDGDPAPPPRKATDHPGGLGKRAVKRLWLWWFINSKIETGHNTHGPQIGGCAPF